MEVPRDFVLTSGGALEVASVWRRFQNSRTIRSVGCRLHTRHWMLSEEAAQIRRWTGERGEIVLMTSCLRLLVSGIDCCPLTCGNTILAVCLCFHAFRKQKGAIPRLVSGEAGGQPRPRRDGLRGGLLLSLRQEAEGVFLVCFCR